MKVDAGHHPAGLEVGDQELGDGVPDADALDGEGGQQLLGLGLHDPLQHLVLEDRPVGEADAELEHLLETGGLLHLLVEAEEEGGGGPRHGGVEQLVTAAGKRAVDGGPGHIGLAGGVLDGGLGQAPAGHAGVGGGQNPLAGVVHRARRRPQRPSSGSSPTVRPGSPAHRLDGQHYPVHVTRCDRWSHGGW